MGMLASRRRHLAVGLIAASIVASAGSWAQSPAAEAPHFVVSTVRVEGNTLLPESVLNGIVAPLAGGERSLEELKQTAAAVQQAYRDRGYGGVVAFVPPQKLSGGGDVVIRVVEGKLAQVNLSGNQLYDERNIRGSLPSLREGQTPRVEDLDRDIQLANENPAKELRVKLAAGANPGEIDANVEVEEESPIRFLLGLDDTGEPSTGDYRLTLGVQHLNLWDLDHIGTAQFQTSPTDVDLVQIYALGYRAPLYGHSASIDVFYGHSSVDSGTSSTAAGPLAFTGKGDVAGVRANRYLDRIGEYDHHVTLGLDWRSYDNECSVGDFGEAGCGPSGVDVTLIPVSLGYTGEVQSPEWSARFSAALAYNLGGSSERTFEEARPGAPRDYTVLRVSALAGTEVGQGFGLQGRITAQYSPDPLVPGEQFGLGGADSVRGYYERELAGDYGFSATLEGLGPVFRYTLAGQDSTLRPLAFVDYGHITNHEDAPCLDGDTSCTLCGAGLGARFTMGKRASARLDLAYAFDDGSETDAGDIRAHFAILLAF